jgi:hypothetical protein
MIYCSIIQNMSTIAEYSDLEGDFKVMSLRVLKANKQPLEFYVVPYSNWEFYYLHEHEYTYCSICNLNLDHEKILVYLQSLKDQFHRVNNDKDSFTIKSTKLIQEMMVIHIFLSVYIIRDHTRIV